MARELVKDSRDSELDSKEIKDFFISVGGMYNNVKTEEKSNYHKGQVTTIANYLRSL